MPSVKNAKIEDYRKFLLELSRSPSRGGNGRAWHSHQIIIGGEKYSWKGLGFRQWIYRGDTVIFEWEFDATGKYRNINPDTIQVTDKFGKAVIRGERGTKQWRTASQRLPASRREQRD
jgi:hypothetical protein